jgi:hypothetical protein
MTRINTNFDLSGTERWQKDGGKKIETADFRIVAELNGWLAPLHCVVRRSVCHCFGRFRITKIFALLLASPGTVVLDTTT